MNSENLLDMFRLLHLLLGTINAHSVLFVNCIHNGLLRYFKQNSCDGSLLNPTGPLPIFHHRPSYTQNVKSKLSLIKNLRDWHVHNSLSNVVIFTCLVLTSIVVIVQGIINRPFHRKQKYVWKPYY